MLVASSCSFFGGSQQDEPRASGADAEPDALSVAAATAGAGDDGRIGDGLLHPQEASAWATRVLVMTTPQPPAARVSGCLEQLRALAHEAADQQAMMLAEEQLAKILVKDPQLYHFCFYQMAVALDERLNARASLFDDLAPAFFDSMRGLWIFARALDRGGGGTRYFDYLKRRYVQISKTVFGRELEFVAPPMRAVKPAH